MVADFRSELMDCVDVGRFCFNGAWSSGFACWLYEQEQTPLPQGTGMTPSVFFICLSMWEV